MNSSPARPSLFDPITINGVTIRNRIVKSAMAEGLADAGGRPTPALIDLYRRWARGGVGLAITGMTYIDPRFSFTDRELGLYDDALVAPLRALTDAVHEHEGRVFAQLNHAPPQIPRAKAVAHGPRAASWGLCRTNFTLGRPYSDAELRAVVRAFAAAAGRARDAGFDGVQLHAAHGYLLSRFLSPRHNRRRDRWGGDFEGRLALLRETLAAVRAEVGPAYPVAIKLNAHDGAAGGLELEDALRVARRLEAEALLDAVEVSAGTADVGLGFYPNRGGIPLDLTDRFLGAELPLLRPLLPLLRPLFWRAAEQVALRQEAYFLPEARRFAAELRVPVICVGGIRSRAVAEQILAETSVAMVSLARPLVRQPALPRAWQRGSSLQAACSSCNRCFVQIGLDQPLRCWSRRGGERDGGDDSVS